jgi:MoaA/NifB/PqqE/SkfB family radical SAM enzyme
MIYPTHLQIETVNKYCNAKCMMCVVHNNSRKAEIMSLNTFKEIIKKILPYKDHFKYVTLHGCGEPLLDDSLGEKILYLKNLNFIGTGFSTNCQALSLNKSYELLDAGLDTLIASIDGVTKQTQEKIRKGTNFETIVENVKNYIELRNSKGNKGRILIRLIRQQENFDEWPEFKKFWETYIDKSKGDDVIRFDIHNCNARIAGFQQKDVIHDKSRIEPCCDLFERLIIFCSGEIAFCSADQSGYFQLENVFEKDPIEVFNNQIFSYHRTKMLEKDLASLELCKNCSIPISRYYKTIPENEK